MELWKPPDDGNRNDTRGKESPRSKVEKHQAVADEAVVVMKFL